MRPVCLTCGIEYHCDKNGVFVQAGNMRTYSGDRWKCPKCGHKMVCGFEKGTLTWDNEGWNTILKSGLLVADCTEAYNPQTTLTPEKKEEMIDEMLHSIEEGIDIDDLIEDYLSYRRREFEEMSDEDLLEIYEIYA